MLIQDGGSMNAELIKSQNLQNAYESITDEDDDNDDDDDDDDDDDELF